MTAKQTVGEKLVAEHLGPREGSSARQNVRYAADRLAAAIDRAVQEQVEKDAGLAELFAVDSDKNSRLSTLVAQYGTAKGIAAAIREQGNK